jgi:hypothetical protein
MRKVLFVGVGVVAFVLCARHCARTCRELNH